MSIIKNVLVGFFPIFFGINAFAGTHFDRVMIVIFENTNYSAAMAQPFFKQVAAQSASFSNFFALTHPSQGNYFALTAGDLSGIKNDDNYDVDVPNIVDLLEKKGLSWKVYAEGFPGNCFTGKTQGVYARKHNPFISFVDVHSDPERCSHIVNANEFDLDKKNNQLPDYVFYIPDLKNDGHNTGVAYADKWYAQKFSSVFADKQLMSNTVIITTFDESGKSPDNRIFTSVSGAAVQPGLYSQSLTTPSLLRMIEDNWGLGSLGKQDASAPSLEGIWK